MPLKEIPYPAEGGFAMKKVLIPLCCALCALILLTALAEEPPLLESLLEEIEQEALNGDALTVSKVTFELSADRQSIYLDRPEVTGSADYTIAYNIYDSSSNPVNYFYSLEDRVAATPGYGGLFNVFVVVTDKATGAQDTQNIGWQEIDWPHGDKLTVGKAAFRLSEDRESVFIDRPDIRCKSGKATIAYNIYDSNGNPVNYFYSNEAHVAATPGYTGVFNVFVVVNDPVAGEMDIQNIGWQELGEQEILEHEWPTTINGIHYDLIEGMVTVTGADEGVTELRFVDEVYGLPVKTIYYWAFAGKYVDGVGYTSSPYKGKLILPAYLERIEWGAFAGCDGLYGTLTIPQSTTHIGTESFDSCSGFTGSLIIPNNVETIGESAFTGCTGLSGELVLPGSLERIGSRAFAGCHNLSGNLIIPDGVRNIEHGVFEECSGFTGSLILPEDTESIGDNAFYGCSGFTGSLILPENTESIGHYAFYGCSGFTGSLVLPESIESIGKGAFGGCHGFTGNLKLPENLRIIEFAAFESCSGFIGDLYIPNNIKRIGAWAFGACIGLRGNLVIAESVTYIEEYAFYSCEGFTGNLVIPNTVLSIGDWAFYGCSNFTGDLEIPEGVTSIGKEAFSCGGLYGIMSVPSSVQTIGSNAFGYNIANRFTSIHCPRGSYAWNWFTNQGYSALLTAE